MTKKIFDVLPPQKSLPPQAPKRDFQKQQKSSFSFPKTLILVFIILGIGMGIIIFLSFQSKLNLSLRPKTTPVEYSFVLEVDTFQENIDFHNNIISGKIFEEAKEKWEKFPSTGEDFEEGKAQGIIQVHNATDPPTPVTLRENTRFLSSTGGKIFRAPERIYLPASEKKAGKIIPSVTKVEVIAQESGEDYNIGSSKFSVPGLAGSALYYTIWAESEKAMEGGFKKEVKKVIKEDLENAKKNLQKTLYLLSLNSLKNKIPQDFLFVDEAIVEKDFQASCFAEPQEVLPEFSCQGKMVIQTVAIKLSDLREIVEYFISEKISPQNEFHQPSLDLELAARTIIIEGGRGKMILDARIRGEVYQKISPQVLSEEIKGKSKSQIEEIFLAHWPQIKEIKFDFWPFWVQTAPNRSERIKIELTF